MEVKVGAPGEGIAAGVVAHLAGSRLEAAGPSPLPAAAAVAPKSMSEARSLAKGQSQDDEGVMATGTEGAKRQASPKLDRPANVTGPEA